MSNQKRSYKMNRKLVLEWLLESRYTIVESPDGVSIFSPSRKELKQRKNSRRRSDNGDARVDLCGVSGGQQIKISAHVSHLVWMNRTEQIIPDGWEIHHLDGNCENNLFENLVCVHPQDHLKLHGQFSEFDEDPF